MEQPFFRQVLGNTWCIELSTSVPLYFLDRHEVVLLDSGYAEPDRAVLQKLLTRQLLHVCAIIGSHSHNDHSGNHAWFQKMHGTSIILRDIEAAIVSDISLMKVAYGPATPIQMEELFGHLLVKADHVFSSEDRNVDVCGKTFGLLPLPGHTAGHTGIVTPDGVLYVGDALVSEQTLQKARLPSTMDWVQDEQSKRRLEQVRYQRYIMAHGGIYDDLQFIISRNLEDHAARSKQILEWLQTSEPLTHSTFEQLLWKQLRLHSSHLMSQIVFRRNAACVLQYLIKTGRIEQSFQDGTCWYRAL